MAKKKHPPRRRHREAVAPADPRQAALHAFTSGHLDDAIAGWSQLAQSDGQVAAALAEALFRRATRAEAPESRLADLRRAAQLAPDDLRIRYQLGLARHRAGDPAAASDSYRAVLARDPAWPGAGYALALATLERDPSADLGALPGASPAVARLAAPVQALLRGQPVSLPGDAPPDRLWQGLAALQQGATDAGRALADAGALPSDAAATRAYYRGVTAARDSDFAGALTAWQAAEQAGLDRPWLRANLAAALARRLRSLDEAGDSDAAAELAQEAHPLASENNALASAAVGALDRAAQAAAAAANWPRAVTFWEAARLIVSAVDALGSPRTIWHNLALAYEAQEDWRAAADAWRGLLRTRSRGRAARGAADGPERPATGPDDAGGLTEAHWAWARRRVIDCFKRAGEPGAAVDVYRQAIKADPADVALRIELADALLANEQEQAAANELQRVLERDQGNVDARLHLATLHANKEEWHAAGALLRAILTEQPERDDVRRQLAQTLSQEGRYWHNLGRLEEAMARLTEGQQLAPDDPDFPIALARVTIDDEQRAAAAAHLARALAIGADRPHVYISALECWGVLGEYDEARRVLAAAEAALPLTGEFFVEAGRVLLADRRVGSPVLGFAPPQGKAPDPRWEALAKELFDRAIRLQPDDPDIYADIATGLVKARPELALQYAKEAARLAPEDPWTIEQFAMIQALNGQRGPAKETLRQAARLARRQGDGDLGHEIDDIVRMVDSPFFNLLLTTALSGGLEDLDDLFA